jgi:hypothetical protein
MMGLSYFKRPEYLYQTSKNLFIFRMKVPADCHPLICKNEVRFSLKTRCLYSAQKHIASILPFLQGTFDGIRQGVYGQTNTVVVSVVEMKFLKNVYKMTSV